MKKQKQNKEQLTAGTENSSNKILQEAIVNTIEEMKLLWSHTTYDGRVAVEKHIEYLMRILKESGYNM